jgi:hypothetical protein
MEKQILNDSFATYLAANPWILLIILWVIVWKALALWKSARKNQKIWFTALLVVNTFGLLEIGYLAYFYFKEKKEGGLRTPSL